MLCSLIFKELENLLSNQVTSYRVHLASFLLPSFFFLRHHLNVTKINVHEKFIFDDAKTNKIFYLKIEVQISPASFSFIVPRIFETAAFLLFLLKSVFSSFTNTASIFVTIELITVSNFAARFDNLFQIKSYKSWIELIIFCYNHLNDNTICWIQPFQN